MFVYLSDMVLAVNDIQCVRRRKGETAGSEIFLRVSNEKGTDCIRSRDTLSEITLAVQKAEAKLLKS